LVEKDLSKCWWLDLLLASPADLSTDIGDLDSLILLSLYGTYSSDVLRSDKAEFDLLMFKIFVDDDLIRGDGDL
jgi:hypothetical protein